MGRGILVCFGARTLAYFTPRVRDHSVWRVRAALPATFRCVAPPPAQELIISLFGSPGGAVPVLEVDGKLYTQSLALLRYAGKRSGLYPDDLIDAMRCDEVMDIASEVPPPAAHCILHRRGTLPRHGGS